MLSGTDKWKGLIDFQLEPLNPGSDILCYTNLSTTLYDALCKTAQSFPDKTAIVDNYDRSCTYTDLLAKTDAFASYLYQKQNIHRNSHVALMMYNCLEFCVSFLALLKLGAVSCIICDQDFYKWFEDFEAQGIRRIACSDIEKGYGLATYHSPETESPVCHDSFDDAIIMFTSGTTSQSKGVVIKNYNI